MRKQLLAAFLTAQLGLLAAGQGGHAEDAETVAIRNAIQLYMSADPVKVREAFYPSANLFMATEKGDVGIIPLEQFLANIARGSASGQAHPEMSIDFIDRVGTAATVKMTEVSNVARVTDYFSLVRDAQGWKVVSKTFNVEHKPEAVASPQNAGQTLCPSGEIQALNFMAGEWKTTESPATLSGFVSGTSRTEIILNGCAIWEHRYEEQKGKELFDAHVIWGYDVTTNRMLLFYVDDGSHAQLYEGRRENGSWAFYRERPGDGRQTVLIRVTYGQKGKGFTQTVERSTDQGHTWEVASVTSYEPKS